MRHLLAIPLVRFTIIAALVGLCAVVLTPSSALAQDAPAPIIVPGQVDLSWTLPTETQCVNPADDPETCTRLPLTGANALSCVLLYVSEAPIPDDFAGEPTAILQPGLTHTQFNGTVPAGATLYFRLKARNASGDSKFTNEVSKLVDLPGVPPGVPTNVTVEIKVGVARATP